MFDRFTHRWIIWLSIIPPHPRGQKLCDWQQSPLTRDLRTGVLCSKETSQSDRSNQPAKTCNATGEQSTQQSSGLMFTTGSSLTLSFAACSGREASSGVSWQYGHRPSILCAFEIGLLETDVKWDQSNKGADSSYTCLPKILRLLALRGSSFSSSTSRHCLDQEAAAFVLVLPSPEDESWQLWFKECNIVASHLFVFEPAEHVFAAMQFQPLILK